MVCACFFFFPDSLKAQDASQDVAEAARQARARKAAQAPGESHVYTNEDLQKPRILSDGDRASAAAHKSPASVPPAAEPQQIAATPAAPSPATQSPAAVGATSDAAGESLGELARRYRREKEARQTEAARKAESASPFHMERSMRPQQAFATMTPKMILELPRPVAEPKKNNPAAGAIAVKRDPFARPGTTALQTGVRPNQASASVVNAARSNSTALPKIMRPATRAAVNIPTNDGKHSVAEPQVSATSIKPSDAVAAKVPMTMSRRSSSSASETSVVASSAASRAAQPSSSHSTVVSTPAVPAVPIAPSISVAPPKERLSAVISVRPLAAGATPTPTATVTMLPGDSLWKLSRRYLGSGGRWPEWVRSNPALPQPWKIRAGTVLAVPNSSGRTSGGAARPQPATSMVVRSGDSLWKISLERWGSGAIWRCLAAANPSVPDANRIYPGESLQLPASCGDVGALRATRHEPPSRP
jgi:LysM repeat protein